MRGRPLTGEVIDTRAAARHRGGMTTQQNTSTLKAPRVSGLARALASEWAPLPVVLAGTFMVVLDFFIVNVALPSMQRDLHASSGSIEWVVAGYSHSRAARAGGVTLARSSSSRCAAVASMATSGRSSSPMQLACGCRDELQARPRPARAAKGVTVGAKDVAHTAAGWNGATAPTLEQRQLVVEAPVDVVALQDDAQLLLALRRRRAERPLEREPIDGVHPAAEQLDAHRLRAQATHLGQRVTPER